MVIVENGIGLPGLPPVSLEVDSGMIDDAVVVGVQSDDVHSN